MSVHQSITAHTRKQHAHLEKFLELEAERERAIDLAVSSCAQGLPFTVDAINEWTVRINQHAKKGISPTRVIVSEEMVREFASRSGHKA